MVTDVSKARAVMTLNSIAKIFKSKEAIAVVDYKSWPTILSTDDIPKKKLSSQYRWPTPEMIAYLDFSVSTTGMLSGVKVCLLTFFIGGALLKIGFMMLI
jgi:hypothetical protein